MTSNTQPAHPDHDKQMSLLNTPVAGAARAQLTGRSGPILDIEVEEKLPFRSRKDKLIEDKTVLLYRGDTEGPSVPAPLAMIYNFNLQLFIIKISEISVQDPISHAEQVVAIAEHYQHRAKHIYQTFIVGAPDAMTQVRATELLTNNLHTINSILHLKVFFFEYAGEDGRGRRMRMRAKVDRSIAGISDLNPGTSVDQSMISLISNARDGRYDSSPNSEVTRELLSAALHMPPEEFNERLERSMEHLRTRSSLSAEE